VMDLSMRSSTWLDVLESEYMAAFVRDGGSAIKFAVPLDDETAATLSAGIESRASQLGYVVAHVDSGQVRVHMMEQVFFAVAAQVPWRETVQQVVARLVEAEGYALPAPGSEPMFVRLAAANDLDPDFLRTTLPRILRRSVDAQVFRNRALAKDFRVAMTHLVVAELGGAAESALDYTVLTDWLCGRNRAVSAVKPFQIFNRISRANARYLFESLLAWLAFAGYAGLVLTVDIGRISVVRNPRDELLHYTRAGVLDAYEVLREFIDGMDRLEHCLIVVVPHRDFLDEDLLGRGIGAYEALKFRVYDEVRDRRLANPMASLVRLTACEPDGGQ
jgi:BREX system ATP-binding protein BrxC/D